MFKKLSAPFLVLCCGMLFSQLVLAQSTTPADAAAVETLAATATATATANVLDTGATAWMMTAAVLVIMMCLPGLAMFYGGMVNARNLLSVFSQFFATAGVIAVLWVVFGYSIATDTTGMKEGVLNLHSFIGGGANFFLANVKPDSVSGGIPDSVLVVFLLSFAIITPALIAGGFAERMKFKSAVIFMALWFSFVYAPVSHMVWGGAGSLMSNWGVLDFAGGTAVHINSGIAALAACLVIGKRDGYLRQSMPPHNLGICLAGAALVWVGWFGFNAGSAVGVSGTTGMVLLNTQIGACAGVLGWMLIEILKTRRPSALGIASGGLAGLVGITPGCAYVSPLGAIAIGFITGIVCFYFVAVIKRKLGYDDTLDVFGLHGVGGVVGALLTGVFCVPALGGYADVNMAVQLLAQFKGVAFTIVYCFTVSWIILKALDKTIGLRVDAETEAIGLDQSEHYEKAYNL